MRQLTVGSLFSGVGGFDLGFERAGMCVLWQVEIDGKCRSVLARHFPEAKVFNDIRDCGAGNLEPVDVVCGGFPCQDLSVAGKREGLAGKRSGLWFEFKRVLEELRPRWVVVENVPGLLSSNGGRDFAILLSGLVELGYGVCWRVLDAQYFGVAQRRRRVFLVGSLGTGRAAQVLFEREGGAWDSVPSREAGEGVAGSSASSFKRRGGFGWSESEAVSGTLESEGGTHQGGPERVPLIVPEVVNCFNGYTGGPDDNDAQGNHLVAVEPMAFDYCLQGSERTYIHRKNGKAQLQAGRPDAIVFQQNQRNEVRDLGDVAGAVQAEPGMKQQNYIALTQWDGQRARIHDPRGIAPTLPHGAESSGNQIPSVVVNTIRAGAGAPKHEADETKLVSSHVGVRRLTTRECERLMGWPDDWTRYTADGEELADTPRYRMCGNGVVGTVSAWLGRRIVEAEAA